MFGNLRVRSDLIQRYQFKTGSRQLEGTAWPDGSKELPKLVTKTDHGPSGDVLCNRMTEATPRQFYSSVKPIHAARESLEF